MTDVLLGARNWRKAMRGGDTQPQVYECDDGREWVVKLPGNPHGVSGLCSDWIGSVLAAEAGVHVPEVSPVIVDEDAIDTLPATSAARGWALPGIGFASLLTGSVDVTTIEQIVAASTAGERARIVVVDTWLDVLDRKKPEPLAWNLLIDTSSLAGRLMCIDYGMCLTDVFQVVLSATTMEPRVPEGWSPHLVGADTEAAIIELASIPEARISTLVQALPPEWQGNPKLATLPSYLQERFAGLRQCLDRGGLL